MLWLSGRHLLVVVALVLDAGAANASGTRYVPAVLSRLDFIPTHNECRREHMRCRRMRFRRESRQLLCRDMDLAVALRDDQLHPHRAARALL